MCRLFLSLYFIWQILSHKQGEKLLFWFYFSEGEAEEEVVEEVEVEEQPEEASVSTDVPIVPGG